jgi:hypothetical protein
LKYETELYILTPAYLDRGDGHLCCIPKSLAPRNLSSGDHARVLEHSGHEVVNTDHRASGR